MDDWIWTTLVRALAFGTPILIAGLGEIYAERSGVVNLGVEGMMAVGALAAFATAQSTGSPLLGLAAAIAAAAALAALFALASITLRANQYVAGLALTMLGLGLSGLLGKPYEGAPLVHPLAEGAFVAAGLLLAGLLWFFLHHTYGGLVLKSAGENPETVDAMGINVYAVRYGAVVFGGAMAGLAGAFLSLAYRPSWADGITSGLGWIAVALAIFSSWEPLHAVFAALLFGALYHLSYRLQAHVSPEFLKAMPYLFVVLVLSLSALKRGPSGAPEALGTPYVRGERR
ncbi:ABC transporter permease [Oceanithermus sp.]